TGGGIKDEYIKKIFDPFFTTKETGTGLGLSITHSSIESMGGELKVHNSEKGAVFTIILPENKNGK
ncbi:MAG TPA: ATP-binding protein, partial [Ignavibacteria bacterium]|nr:ATP-binding protein [Ignavibacteria bacterium]